MYHISYSFLPQCSTRSELFCITNLIRSSLPICCIFQVCIYRYIAPMILFVYCSPPIESTNMRYAMLNQQSDLIGDTKAFDGATLFLPTVSVSLTCTRNTILYMYIVYFFVMQNNFALGTCTCNTYMCTCTTLYVWLA